MLLFQDLLAAVFEGAQEDARCLLYYSSIFILLNYLFILLQQHNSIMVQLPLIITTIYTLFLLSSPELMPLPPISSQFSGIFDTLEAFKNDPQTVLLQQQNVLTIQNLHQIELKPQKFNDVSLNHQLPQYFLLNQIFQVHGKVNATKLAQYFSTQPRNKTTYVVNVVFLSQESGKQYIFSSKEIPKNQLDFTIQCYFDHPDTYFMGIFIGEQAQFTPRIFQVREAVDGEQYLSQLESEDLPPKPQNLSLSVEENEMIVRWPAISSLCKLIFSQRGSKNITKQFLVSNDQGYITIPYFAFRDFQQAETQVSLEYAWTQDIGAYSRISLFSEPYKHRFNVTEHHFRVYRPDLLHLENIPSMVSLKTSVELKGESNEKMRPQIFVIQPDNQIISKNLKANSSSEKYINPNEKFEFSEDINEEGVYFIEINHQKGWALLNTPIYAGSRYPLLPDYNDLYPYMKEGSQFQYNSMNSYQNSQNSEKSSPTTLDQQRNLLLSLINQKRKQFHQEPLILDDELNKIAQAHSQDMADNDYASHTNLYGESANDRARNAGFSMPVGEVIAVNEDLEFGQYRLARSPIHLKNIINPQWYRAGIGIAKNYRGVYYITQNFSTKDPIKDEVSSAEMEQYKQQLMDGIIANAGRKITENKKFSADLNKWHLEDWTNMDKLKSLMAKYRAYKISYQKISLTFTHNFVSLLQKQGYLKDRGFNNAALSLVINERNLEIAMIFF